MAVTRYGERSRYKGAVWPLGNPGEEHGGKRWGRYRERRLGGERWESYASSVSLVGLLQGLASERKCGEGDG